MSMESSLLFRAAIARVIHSRVAVGAAAEAAAAGLAVPMPVVPVAVAVAPEVRAVPVALVPVAAERDVATPLQPMPTAAVIYRRHLLAVAVAVAVADAESTFRKRVSRAAREMRNGMRHRVREQAACLAVSRVERAITAAGIQTIRSSMLWTPRRVTNSIRAAI